MQNRLSARIMNTSATLPTFENTVPAMSPECATTQRCPSPIQRLMSSPVTENGSGPCSSQSVIHATPRPKSCAIWLA